MRYFTLEELCQSQTATRLGLDNTPTPDVQKSLEALVENILDPLRTLIGRPITISSGYRSPKVNKAVGGSPTSQHVLGEAADINCHAIGTRELFNRIKSSPLPFDQLIFEGTWVHISFGLKNRRQVLYAKFTNGKATYFTHE